MWARFFQARLAWVSMTPLGRPVVPDVYIKPVDVVAASDARGPPVVSGAQLGRVVHPPSAGEMQARTSVSSRPFRRLVGQIDQPRRTRGPGPGVLEDVAHLGRGQPPVDRHGDGPEVVGGEDRLQELRAVVGEEATTSPGRRPGSVQAAGQRAGPVAISP
jgi:hypothetical protein